jgi:D,D-heptose 1,7-bisphosphate phosphatase
VKRQLVIVAGGKGTRLGEQFGNVPKALVPLADKPILLHQLEWARHQRFEKVEIFAGHLAEQIVQFVQRLNWTEPNITVHTEEEPMGNAGAVISALPHLEDRFTVVYGDLLLDLNVDRLEDFHRNRQADFTTVVHPNDHPFDSDIIQCDAHWRVEKIHLYPHQTTTSLPNMVNAAMYMIERDSLVRNFKAVGKADFTKTIMPGLLAVGAHVAAYLTNEYVKDVGTPDRLVKGADDIANGVVRTSDISIGRAVIFLDRDGTLNEDDGQVTKPERVKLLPSVPEALKKLRSAGYQLVIVTNQPMVAKGQATETDLQLVHQELQWQLGLQRVFVDRIYYCPHHPDKGFEGEREDLKIDCQCRKPRIGMFQQACQELDVDPSRSWMIGDRTVDIEFARRAGLRSVLLQTGDAGRDGKYEKEADFVAESLMEAAELICGETIKSEIPLSK